MMMKLGDHDKNDDDHHGSGGMEDMFKDYMDPERANQQLLEAIPGYIATLPERF
jgi:hypothetical protein